MATRHHIRIRSSGPAAFAAAGQDVRGRAMPVGSAVVATVHRGQHASSRTLPLPATTQESAGCARRSAPCQADEGRFTRPACAACQAGRVAYVRHCHRPVRSKRHDMKCLCSETRDSPARSLPLSCAPRAACESRAGNTRVSGASGRQAARQRESVAQRAATRARCRCRMATCLQKGGAGGGTTSGMRVRTSPAGPFLPSRRWHVRHRHTHQHHDQPDPAPARAACRAGGHRRALRGDR